MGKVVETIDDFIEENLNNILKKYNIAWKINDKDLFVKALTHPSCAKEYFDSYERLEFLGDSVIRLTLSDYIYHRFPMEREGFMTKLRTRLERGTTLSQLAKASRISDYVLLSDSQGARKSDNSIFEDVFESFVGALYKDSSFLVCKEFIVNVIEAEIDIAKTLFKDDNYKAQLLQHYHKLKWSDPKYLTVSVSEDRDKTFTMCVKDEFKNIIGVGSGSTKKGGEQEAAKRALLKLGAISEDDFSDDDAIWEDI